MGTAFVFDPDAKYGRVGAIRKANVMPQGVHLLASVTGPWKNVAIVDFDSLDQLATRVEALGGHNGSDDPPTATVIGAASKVKRSVYAAHMAFIRIEVREPDPTSLLPEITTAIGSDEADVVAGDFDIFACAVDNDEGNLGSKIFAVRAINGVKRTVSLRVIDFVSEAPGAPGFNRVPKPD